MHQLSEAVLNLFTDTSNKLNTFDSEIKSTKEAPSHSIILNFKLNIFLILAYPY